AAERFRRADWKTKAQDAAVRLGGVPGEIPLETSTPIGGDFALTSPPVMTPDPTLPFEQDAAALESMVAISSEVQQATDTSASALSTAEPAGKRRRRGRRGGRNRRKGGAGREAASAAVPRASETSA